MNPTQDATWFSIGDADWETLIQSSYDGKEWVLSYHLSDWNSLRDNNKDAPSIRQ